MRTTRWRCWSAGQVAERTCSRSASRGPDQLMAAIREVAQGGSVIDPRVVEGLVAQRTRVAQSPIADLTARERDVLASMAEGKTNAAIADALTLTPRGWRSTSRRYFRSCRWSNPARSIDASRQCSCFWPTRHNHRADSQRPRRSDKMPGTVHQHHAERSDHESGDGQAVEERRFRNPRGGSDEVDGQVHERTGDQTSSGVGEHPGDQHRERDAPASAPNRSETR